MSGNRRNLCDVIVDKLVSIAGHRFSMMAPQNVSCVLITVHTRPTTTTRLYIDKVMSTAGLCDASTDCMLQPWKLPISQVHSPWQFPPLPSPTPKQETQLSLRWGQLYWWSLTWQVIQSR